MTDEDFSEIHQIRTRLDAFARWARWFFAAIVVSSSGYVLTIENRLTGVEGRVETTESQMQRLISITDNLAGVPAQLRDQQRQLNRIEEFIRYVRDQSERRH